MAEPLRVIGEADTAQESWQSFLKRRQALEAQMHLEICDGCDHCGTRCIAGFGVTQSEWEAVVAYLAQEPPSERERVRSQIKKHPWPGSVEGATIGVGGEAQVAYCQFRDLEKNRCSIYPVRPTICRLFGHTDWLPCPIGAVPAYPEEAAPLWNNYRRQKRKTWEEWQEEEIEGEVSNG